MRYKGKIVADATNYEVVKKIIIPGSADKGSYMETMPGGKHDPQFLVSHWWGDVLLPRWHVCFQACHTTLGQKLASVRKLCFSGTVHMEVQPLVRASVEKAPQPKPKSISHSAPPPQPPVTGTNCMTQWVHFQQSILMRFGSIGRRLSALSLMDLHAMLLWIMMKSKIISHMAARWTLTDRTQAAALAVDLTADRSYNRSGSFSSARGGSLR